MIIIGLDNGFYVKGVKKLPRKIHDGWKGIETDGDVELAYWRKCWGIRDEILWTLGADHQGGENYPVSREKLKEIIEVLKKFTNKESMAMRWDESGRLGHNKHSTYLVVG